MHYHLPFEIVVDAQCRAEAEEAARAELEKLGAAVSLYAHSYNTQSNIAVLPSARRTMNKADL